MNPKPLPEALAALEKNMNPPKPDRDEIPHDAFGEYRPVPPCGDANSWTQHVATCKATDLDVLPPGTYHARTVEGNWWCFTIRAAPKEPQAEGVMRCAPLDATESLPPGFAWGASPDADVGDRGFPVRVDPKDARRSVVVREGPLLSVCGFCAEPCRMCEFRETETIVGDPDPAPDPDDRTLFYALVVGACIVGALAVLAACWWAGR